MEKKTEKQKVDDILKRLAFLQDLRRPYESLWDEEIEFAFHTMRPVRADQGYQNEAGRKTGITVYDGTAMSAINLMADGFQGYLVGRALRWFALRLPHKVQFSRVSLMRAYDQKRLDQIPEVRRWLSEKEEVSYSAFQRSNFYDVLGRNIRDAATVGTTYLYSDEDLQHGTISFQVLHPRQCFIGENCYSRVDTIYRRYPVTLRKIVQKWGLDALPTEDMRREYGQNPYSEKMMIHAVYPRDEIEMYPSGRGNWEPKQDAKNKPFASCWIMEGQKRLLSESGFDMLPINTWRWELNTGDLYGWSPTAEALVDIITANQIGKDLLVASQMAAMPMWNVPEEMRGKVNVRPRALNYFKDPARVMSAIETRQNVPVAKDREEIIKKAIRDRYHVEFFMMLSRAAFEGMQLTATQVIEMQGEKAAVMGAKIGRFESEFLDQIIDRVDQIETEGGRMPEPPQVLFEFGGKDIQVDYIGPLAQTQKALFRRQGASAALESVRPWFEMFPDSRLVVNPDIVIRKTLQDTESFPSDAIRDEEEVEELKAQIAQANQQAQELAMAERMAAHSDKMGKAPETGSPMEKLMNAGGAEQFEGA